MASAFRLSSPAPLPVGARGAEIVGFLRVFHESEKFPSLHATNERQMNIFCIGPKRKSTSSLQELTDPLSPFLESP